MNEYGNERINLIRLKGRKKNNDGIFGVYKLHLQFIIIKKAHICDVNSSQ